MFPDSYGGKVFSYVLNTVEENYENGLSPQNAFSRISGVRHFSVLMRSDTASQTVEQYMARGLSSRYKGI